ncbi:MAG: hypothetical protein LCH39_08620 [Proteobacteria bacterium]|nr:hypothetical protein [Pseudomonadota bacterium]
MRSLALSVLFGASLLAGGVAQAQDRELTLRVKPRSWLDAGTQVEVGSKQSYVYDQMGSSDLGRFGARGSQASFLPSRPGSGITFMSPQWWEVR